MSGRRGFLPGTSLAVALGCLACGKPTLVTGEGGSAAAPGAAPSFNLPDASSTSSGGGTPPGGAEMACAADSHEVKPVPLDLVLLVDTSGSMYELIGTGPVAGRQPKWALAVGGLHSFLKDPKSAGLGIGLQFFPLNGSERMCAIDGDCNIGPTIAEAGSCAPKSVCTTNGQPVYKNRPCNPTIALPDAEGCPFGGTCTALGRCDASGAPCYTIGQPCPGGGGMCGGRGTLCRNIGVGSCNVADYENLAVPIGELPGAEPALGAAIDNKEPIGFTPTTAALQGVINHLRQHLTEHPERQGALVLFTDGIPLGCDGNSEATTLAAIRAAHDGTPSISTYVIGVFGVNPLNGTLDGWARAGGTTQATVLTPTEDLSQKFLDTLNEIRGRALPCEFTIPPQNGTIDYHKVNVRASGAAGTQDLLYVSDVTRCDPTNGGWYYDQDPATGTPTRVIVCPATCERFKNGDASKLDLLFGCATRVIR